MRYNRMLIYPVDVLHAPTSPGWFKDHENDCTGNVLMNQNLLKYNHEVIPNFISSTDAKKLQKNSK